MTIFIFIFFILVLLYCYIINLYHRAWNSIPEQIQDESPRTFISVVIPVRNEETRIPALVESLLAQDYPAELFEVIFVNDHSNDDSLPVLINHAEGNKNLKLCSLPPADGGKKKAIEFGVRQSSGTLIITTDADCTLPIRWLHSFASFYQRTHARFIAAPVKMISQNSVLGIFQRLDFMTMQGITGASVAKRLHMMCNGANLAYERQVFFEVNGFEGIDGIPSGDDMLLMYKVFKQYPKQVMYLKSRNVIVETPAEFTIRKFFNQRIRWASKGAHFEDARIFYVLLLTWLVNAGFIVFTTLCLFNPAWWWLLVLMFMMKVLVEYPFVNSISNFFNERRLMKYFPLLQPLHILYVVVAGWLGRFGSYEWKSRITRNTTASKLVKQ